MNPKRQAILDALGTVTGLSASATQPASVVAGSAWPGWAQTVRVNGCLNNVTYFAYVALPAAMADVTVDAGDEIADTIADALTPVGKVTRYEPWRIPVEPGQQPIPVIRYTIEV